jgi:Fe2+ transport system protein FeoA
MVFELGEAKDIGISKGCGRRERRGWGRGHGRHDQPGAGEACDGRRGTGQSAASGACRLCQAASGDTVTVTGILGGEAFRGRIMAMGILPGVTLRVVGGGNRQPLLVALPGSRCVVDRRSSEMIAVRPARAAADHEGIAI